MDNLTNFMLDIGAHQDLQVFWGLCNMSGEKDRQEKGREGESR